MDFSVIDILTQLGNLGAPLSVSLMLFALMRQQMKAVNSSIERMLTLIERLSIDCGDTPPPNVAAESAAPDADSPGQDSETKTRPFKLA